MCAYNVKQAGRGTLYCMKKTFTNTLTSKLFSLIIQLLWTGLEIKLILKAFNIYMDDYAKQRV